MREVATAILVSLAVALSLLPAVMTLCDRVLTRARLGARPARCEPAAGRAGRMRAEPGAPSASRAAFFEGIARGVRAGLPVADAITAAPPCSGAARQLQEALAGGVTLADALSATNELHAVLRGCMPGGSLSPVALDLAAANARAGDDLRGEVNTAVSYARHSARLLTVLPFLMLGGAAALSRDARDGLLTAGPVTCIVVGSVANLVGSRWMGRIITTACRRSPVADAAGIAEGLVIHLSAGGTVPSALDALADGLPGCAATARMLHAGLPLSEALSPLRRTAPTVTDTIEQAHRDGLPLVTALARATTDLRARDRDHVLAAVRRIPARAAAPLVLCALPSFVLTAVLPLGLASIGAVRTPAT